MIKKRFLSMLVLLCLTVSGAWAQEERLLTTIVNTGDNASFKSGSKTFDNIATVTFSGEVYNHNDGWGWWSQAARTLTVTAAGGYTITRVKFYTLLNSAFDEEAPFEAILGYDDYDNIITKVNGTSIGQVGVTKIEVYGYGPYKVSLKEGTEDATSWQGKAGTGEYQALPLERVTATTAVSVKYNGTKKVKSVKAVRKLLSMATTSDCGKVVCAAGHLHPAKTAVPSECTAVGILGKVTETGHGLILSLWDAPQQSWATILGWTSVTTTYAGTTLKQMPDDGALGNLKSYTTLGYTTVSNWCVAQKGDYEAIFTNLGSTNTSYDDNVNAYLTTGVGGAGLSFEYWSATKDGELSGWFFYNGSWDSKFSNYRSNKLRPVLGF